MANRAPARKSAPAKAAKKAVKAPAKPAPKAKKAAPKPVAKKPAPKAPAKKPVGAVKKLVSAVLNRVKAVAAPKPAAKGKIAAKPAKAGPVAKSVAKPAGKTVPKTAATKAAPTKAAPHKATPVKDAPAKVIAAVSAPKAPAKPAAPAKGTASVRGPIDSPTADKSVGRAQVAVAVPAKPVKRNPPQKVTPENRVDLPPGYKPSGKDAEYMSALHVEYFRQKLANWRAELVEESKQTIENLRDEVRDVGDEAERATRETENSLELRTRDRYRKLIGKIDKALRRIEEGEYGYCEETGEEIGVERLEARPIATLCLDAQERWEHRQRQMGD